MLAVHIYHYRSSSLSSYLAIHLCEDADCVSVDAPGELRVPEVDGGELDPGLGGAQVLAQLTSRAPVTGADLQRLVWLTRLLANHLLFCDLENGEYLVMLKLKYNINSRKACFCKNSILVFSSVHNIKYNS